MDKGIRIQRFNYTKLNGEESERRVLILDEDDVSMYGIDLQYVADSDVPELIETVEKLNNLVGNNMRGYRNFKKSNIALLEG